MYNVSKVRGSDAKIRVGVVSLPAEVFRKNMERRSVLSLGGISVLYVLVGTRKPEKRFKGCGWSQVGTGDTQ